MTSRRRQKYIDIEVQASLVRRLLIHWAIFLVANLCAVTFCISIANIQLGDSPNRVDDPTSSLLLQIILPMIVVSIALLPAFLWDAVKLSNRFVGPVRQVRRALASMLNGETPKPIAFRTGDYWHSLATDLNRAFELKGESKKEAATTGS